MDAHAHLTGLGWRGEGHSLDKQNRGLKRPILISHKTDLHGLGSKKQKEKQADQWWLNAFDNALKDLGQGKESSLSKIKESGAGRGGLYGFFVRGQQLDSTFDSNSTGTSTPETSTVQITGTIISSTASPTTSTETPATEAMGRPKQAGRFQRRTKGASGANSEPLSNPRIFTSSDKVVEEAAPAPEPVELLKKVKREQKPQVQEPEIDPPAVTKTKKEKKHKHREEPEANIPIPEVKKEKKEKKRKPVEEVEIAPQPTEHKKDKKRKRHEEANGDAEPDISESRKEKKRKRKEDPVDSPQEDLEVKEPKVIVDGIAIPAPKKIEKIKKERAKDVRERRKKERAEAATEGRKVNREKAIEDGTWNFEDEARRKKERNLERAVNEELERREKRGDYGPLLPHPTKLLAIEKEVYNELKKTGELGNLELEKQRVWEKVGVSF